MRSGAPTENEGDLRRTAESLRRQLASEHPDEETLVAYVDGTLDPTAREAVGEHLAGCATCSETVADLTEVRQSLARVGGRAHTTRWLLAAAIAGAAILAGILYLRSTTTPRHPLPSAGAYGRPEWDALVAGARATGRVTPPAAWTAVQSGPDVIRGSQGSGTAGTFVPSATVIESRQPEFSWPATPGAAYVVRVSSGTTEIMHSELLHQASWKPAAPLSRGLTYMWQVEARHGGRVEVMPLPPHPTLLFFIADERAARDLAEARRRFPNDHLLLGLLCGQAGMREGAQEELARWVARHPDDRTARELLASVSDWTRLREH
jgi:hypothetical protein